MASSDAAVEIGARIVERGVVALLLGLRLIERRLVVARIDRVEQVAFLDVGAVGDMLLLDIARTWACSVMLRIDSVRAE